MEIELFPLKKKSQEIIQAKYFYTTEVLVSSVRFWSASCATKVKKVISGKWLDNDVSCFSITCTAKIPGKAGKLPCDFLTIRDTKWFSYHSLVALALVGPVYVYLQVLKNTGKAVSQ